MRNSIIIEAKVVVFSAYHVHVEELLVLRNQCILWLDENLDQHRLGERVEWNEHRKTTDELWDHSELDQIARLHLQSLSQANSVLLQIPARLPSRGPTYNNSKRKMREV